MEIIAKATTDQEKFFYENQACVDMVARVAKHFGIKPECLAADTACGNAPTLKSLVEQGIEPHIPIWDKSQRHDGTFSRSDFAYDQAHDKFICPGGKALKTKERVHDGRTRLYRTRKPDCDACALKPQCCPNAPHRRLSRDIDEPARNRVRTLAKTPAFKPSRDERKNEQLQIKAGVRPEIESISAPARSMILVVCGPGI